MIFTTKYFREQREMLSEAQFESEFQQRPFEEKGVTFPRNKLNYFFRLPEGIQPDAIVAFCDTAQKGSDYTACGVGMIYGTECYISGVVFDDSPPDVTVPQVAKLLMDSKVQKVTFESNNSGTYYARDVAVMMKDRGYNCGVETKYTVSNKQTRIEMASANIIKHFWFRHESTYDKSSQYAQFMRNVWAYTRSGKVPHDDGPDMLSMMENGIRSLALAKVEFLPRPF
jgi:predicted phage terminase large subunit-like protein